MENKNIYVTISKGLEYLLYFFAPLAIPIKKINEGITSTSEVSEDTGRLVVMFLLILVNIGYLWLLLEIGFWIESLFAVSGIGR